MLQESRSSIARLVTDEDLHALGAHALIEQVQDVALGSERLEQALQRLDVGELPRGP